MNLRRIFLTTAMTVFTLGALPAQAALLDFEFVMTAASGTSVDFGLGNVDLSGLDYTITGSTVSDTDLFNGGAIDTVGGFAATLNFNFGAAGTFSTSTSQTDIIYIQNCNTSVSITCSGFTNLVATVGFLANFNPIAVVDANVGAALGSNIAANSTNQASPWLLTNFAGESLTLFNNSTSITEFSVTESSSVPTPPALPLLLSGIMLLALGRRNFDKKTSLRAGR